MVTALLEVVIVVVVVVVVAVVVIVDVGGNSICIHSGYRDSSSCVDGCSRTDSGDDSGGGWRWWW